MLKRPSSRRKSKHGQGIEINLVPILDTMVTLIGFLLFTTSFIAIVSIESQLPQTRSNEIQDALKEKPLQLTLTVKDSEVEIWSPFQKFTARSIPHTHQGLIDIKTIHEALLEIKKQFPTESTLVIVPTPTVAYDTLIELMDAARTLEATDSPIYVKNEITGLDETIKTLFPAVVFGNLLGDT